MVVVTIHNEFGKGGTSGHSAIGQAGRLTSATSSTAALLTTVERIKDLVSAILH